MPCTTLMNRQVLARDGDERPAGWSSGGEREPQMMTLRLSRKRGNVSQGRRSLSLSHAACASAGLSQVGTSSPTNPSLFARALSGGRGLVQERQSHGVSLHSGCLPPAQANPLFQLPWRGGPPPTTPM